MSPDPRSPRGFSRREAQIMDALFALGEASVSDVRERLPDPPSETAVRTLLGLLVERGHAVRRRDGRRNLFRAALSRERAGRSALRRVIDVFYDGSLGDALAAHLSDPRHRPDDAEVARLAALVRDALEKDER